MLDTGALVPLRFVVGPRRRRAPGGRRARRPVRPRRGLSRRRRAHRRLHDLPGHGRRRSPARACSAGPGAGPARRPGPRPARPHHRPAPHGRRHAVRRRRRHGADARTDLRRRRGAPSRPGRCSCSAPAAAASTRAWPGSWRRARASRLLCGRYEGVDDRVRDHLVRRRAVDRRLRARRRRGGGHGRARGGRPPGARGDGQRRLGRRGVLQRRAARVPAVHPAGRRSGARTVPEVLRSGDHGRVARWRRAQALRRTLDRPSRPHRGPGRPHAEEQAPARRVRPGDGRPAPEVPGRTGRFAVSGRPRSMQGPLGPASSVSAPAAGTVRRPHCTPGSPDEPHRPRRRPEPPRRRPRLRRRRHAQGPRPRGRGQPRSASRCSRAP